MNASDPNMKRIAGYIILFAGIISFALCIPLIKKWANLVTAYIFCAVGVIFCAVAVIWSINNVRCPHC